MYLYALYIYLYICNFFRELCLSSEGMGYIVYTYIYICMYLYAYYIYIYMYVKFLVICVATFHQYGMGYIVYTCIYVYVYTCIYMHSIYVYIMSRDLCRNFSSVWDGHSAFCVCARLCV